VSSKFNFEKKVFSFGLGFALFSFVFECRVGWSQGDA
jgi:hypothetical protein